MPDDRDSGPGAGNGADRPRPLSSPLWSAALPDAVECPFCGGRETEQMAAFGSALSVSQYWCRSCRTVFEYMKWRGAARETTQPREALPDGLPGPVRGRDPKP